MNETLYHTNFLELKSTPAKDGSPWYYAHRPNAKDAVVILTICGDEILFLIEERPPMQAENIGKYTIGLAAGLVGDERFGETIENAIKSELLEEAGLIAEKIDIKSNKISSSAGCVSETFTVAIVKVKEKTPIQKPISDNGIIVDRVWIKKENLHTWLHEMETKGHVLTAQSLAALFYLYE